MPELVTLLFVAGIFFAWRWWTVWRVGQLRKSLAQALADSQNPSPRLDPESKFIIRLSEDSISCERPDGTIEQVAWDDLQRVDILSTSDGPWLPDQCWILSGSNSRCVIPWGATGADQLLERLQELPNFDSGVVIEAASQTSESVRTCWQKGSPPP